MSRMFNNASRDARTPLPVLPRKPALGAQRLGDRSRIPAALHCAAETLPVVAAVPDLDADRLSRAFATLRPAARTFGAGAVSL